MDPRRRERTTDPQRLARHLGAALQEIADEAYRVDKGELARTQNALGAIKDQLSNMSRQVAEHEGALYDAQRFREAPEFDVITEQADTGQPAPRDSG